MSSWSDSFLRSLQFWMFYLGLGVPLLGVLLGGVCMIVRDRAGSELGQRAGVASAREAELRQKSEADLRVQLDQTLARDKELESERPAPRLITPAQRARFIDQVEFSPKGKVSVYVTTGADPATADYAKHVWEMIGAGGYDAGALQETGRGKQIPKGLFMLVGHEKHPFAGAIQQALAEIGISATGLIDATIPGDEVRIEVGARP